MILCFISPIFSYIDTRYIFILCEHYTANIEDTGDIEDIGDLSYCFRLAKIPALSFCQILTVLRCLLKQICWIENERERERKSERLGQPIYQNSQTCLASIERCWLWSKCPERRDSFIQPAQQSDKWQSPCAHPGNWLWWRSTKEGSEFQLGSGGHSVSSH